MSSAYCNREESSQVQLVMSARYRLNKIGLGTLWGSLMDHVWVTQSAVSNKKYFSFRDQTLDEHMQFSRNTEALQTINADRRNDIVECPNDVDEYSDRELLGQIGRVNMIRQSREVVRIRAKGPKAHLNFRNDQTRLNPSFKPIVNNLLH